MTLKAYSIKKKKTGWAYSSSCAVAAVADPFSSTSLFTSLLLVLLRDDLSDLDEDDDSFFTSFFSSFFSVVGVDGVDASLDGVFVTLVDEEDDLAASSLAAAALLAEAFFCKIIKSALQRL